MNYFLFHSGITPHGKTRCNPLKIKEWEQIDEVRKKLLFKPESIADAGRFILTS